MPKRAAACEEGREREEPVAEIGLGGRAEAGDGAARREPRASPPSVMCVAWTRHQRRRPAPGRAATRPAARRSRRGSPRPRASARRRGYGSARRHRGDAAGATAARSASGVTARSECGAMPMRDLRVAAMALRQLLDQRAGTRRRSMHEAALACGRRLRRRSRRWLVEHRQQGQADAGCAAAAERCARDISAGSA